MPMNVPQRRPRPGLPNFMPRPSPRSQVLNPPPGLPIKMTSMHGMGDNLHQRAIVRRLMEQNVVYLDTPWPSVYHDLQGSRLKLIRPAATTLRTQAKNVVREAAKYDVTKAPRQVRMVRTWYTGEEVKAAGSVLGAMARAAGVGGELDFRMPVPWSAELPRGIVKPIMIYRPLIERTEWGGCASRNPDEATYYALFQSIRQRYFVISVADLMPGKEWMVGHGIKADLELHHGELSFESLAALTHHASLVFCSPGFAVPLAQAVGTPVVCVFGGYENSSSFSLGARYTPTLGIDPIIPCSCFSHTHAHSKVIDLFTAFKRLTEFVEEAKHAPAATSRLGSAVARHRLGWAQPPVHESGGAGDPDCVGGIGATEERAGVRRADREDSTSVAAVLSDD